MSTRPRVRARPIIDSDSAGSTIPGNKVTMSMRMSVGGPGSEIQQAVGGADDHAAGGDVDVEHDVRHCGDEVLAPVAGHHPQVLRAAVLDPGDAADQPAVLGGDAGAL